MDEIASRTLAPEGDVLGRRVCVYCGHKRPERWYEVVCVVSSMRHAALDGNVGPSVYLSSRAFESADFLVVRAQHPNPELVQQIRRAVASADPDQPVLLSATMSTLIGDSIADRRFIFSMLSITGILALLLAAAGVYGVVVHTTSRRTREIGIRIAVGATPLDILELLFVQGMCPVVLGVAVGILGASSSLHVLRSAFRGLASVDPWTFVLAIAIVLAAATAACLIPAVRAARLDPVSGLRQ